MTCYATTPPTLALCCAADRVELGDLTDLPFTINTSPTPKRWSLALNSTRHNYISGGLNGCNMTMRRALVERLGPFDENFGPGSRMGSGDEAEYVFRAYVNGITLEYVPDMTVLHHHGLKTSEQGRALFRRYLIGWGGLHAKYLFKRHHHQTHLDLKQVVKEVITGTNTFLPQIGFSHTDKLVCIARGALRYFLMHKESVPN